MAFDIQEYCGRQTYMKLSQMAEQPANQFIKGQATTAFSTLNTVAAGANNIMAATEMALTADKVELITTLSQQTWNYAKEQLTYFGKLEIAYITNKALTLPSYVVKRTTYWTTYWTAIEMKNISIELNQDQDERNDNELEKKNKKATEDKIKDFKTKTAYINNRIAAVTRDIYSYITTVTKYITTGPEWLQKNLNETIYKTINPLQKQLRKEDTKVYNEVLNFLDSKADDLGHKAAKKTADKARDTMQKANTKAQKLLKTGISFAKSALQLIKQKAMALIGA